MDISWPHLTREVEAIAGEWRAKRAERQARRHLDAADFARLNDAGFLHVAVPEEGGGLWRSVAETTRPICDVLRPLAAADPSVALVASMHPAVLAFWLAKPDPASEAWTEQREAVCATAADGLQWGTITSEPGSGGDMLRTKSLAEPDDADGSIPGMNYRVTGDKHFGSGSGVTSFMVTTAVPAGEDAPTIFVLDVRDRPWDGSTGMRLTAEWDGAGMAATQSHAMRLESCPATRMAWDGPVQDLAAAAGPLISSVFTAVVLGVFDEAIATAKQQLEPKLETLRAVRAGRVGACRDGALARGAGVRGRPACRGDGRPSISPRRCGRRRPWPNWPSRRCARLTRVLGGGTFSRRSPFASWFEDVRALGFLRPPWGLAYDGLFQTSFS